MDTSQKGWIMKRIALLTLLVGLFFGSMVVVLAGGLATPPFYITWKLPVTYTCVHTAYYDELLTAITILNYNVPTAAVMTEVDTSDNSVGHFVVVQDEESDWINGRGQRQHIAYAVDSASYPITLKADIKTYVNNVPVYESTLTATCTDNSHGTLNASIDNNLHPLHAEVWPGGSIGIVHP